MAYQYQTGIAKNSKDLMVKLRDFIITTTGWTSVQDTVTDGSAGQYIAASSTGESGNDKNVIRCLVQSTFLSMHGWLSWSAGTGKSLAGLTASGMNMDANNYVKYWFFGSLDRVVVFVSAPSQLFIQGGYLGSYTRLRSANRAVTANAESAGTSVVVEVNNTTYFTVGQRYVIADDNGYEYPKVTAISAGVSVTMDVLQNSYAAGAWVGEDPRPLIASIGTTAPIFNADTNGIQPVAAPGTGGIPVTAGGGQSGAGGFAIRGVDTNLIERVGVEGMLDVAAPIDMFPMYYACEYPLSAGVLGTLTEVYQIPRVGLATDDTITVGGSTYHVIETTPASVGSTTSLGSVAYAVRRA